MKHDAAIQESVEQAFREPYWNRLSLVFSAVSILFYLWLMGYSYYLGSKPWWYALLFTPFLAMAIFNLRKALRKRQKAAGR